MPRGLGSKLRAREKRHRETQGSHPTPNHPQAPRADKKESKSCSRGASTDAIPPSTSAEDSPKKKGGALPTTSKAPRTTTSKAPVASTTKVPANSTSKAPPVSTSRMPVAATSKMPLASTSQMPLAKTSKIPPVITSKAPPATTSKAAAGDSLKKSCKSANPRRAEAAGPAKASPSNERPWKDFILRKAGMLMQYLLYKYKTQQPIVRGEMVKIINRKFKDYFPEILQKASERIDLVFGLELKEIKPNSPCYTLVNKAELSSSEMPSGLDFPKNGLLMPLLGVIFLHGNCAKEEEVWDFLSILGVYDGRKHIIFGEPRKLITQDMVKEKYLEYQLIPGSDPPSYQFLWGPRAHAETTKMQVLEFLAKVNDTVPSDFPGHYEEALRDEEERARAKVSVKHGNPAKAKAPAGPSTSSYQQ
ncbi:melanoma-associated antigen B2-like [Perognathus longimembris pacificus]|uniref:melanoma-associated antigen B2-like n=1 Tax=Perognathus longimembris pacificus TaxID=214514 RepID=UPI002018A091|nr:melanoma-associated antigen B2-like [Perognathus longimembris pacificus]